MKVSNREITILKTCKNAPKGCSICSGKLVTIRGKHPGDANRKVCPTCLQERMERISNMEYDVACKE